MENNRNVTPKEAAARNDSKQLAEFLASKPPRLAAMREALDKRAEESRDICFHQRDSRLYIQTMTLLSKEEVKELGEDVRSQIFKEKPTHYKDIFSISLDCVTKSDWIAFTNVLRAKSDKWAALRKEARRIWWEYRSAPKRDYPYDQGIVGWAKAAIEYYDQSCADNFRIAHIGDRKALRNYRRDKEEGCCGFIDEKHICPLDGKTYLIGCNYGH